MNEIRDEKELAYSREVTGTPTKSRKVSRAVLIGLLALTVGASVFAYLVFGTLGMFIVLGAMLLMLGALMLPNVTGIHGWYKKPRMYREVYDSPEERK